MNRDDLIRLLRKYARRRDLELQVMKSKGKGAHYRLRLGARLTTLQSGELSPFHVERICKQLGIKPGDL